MTHPAELPTHTQRIQRQVSITHLADQLSELAAHLDAGEYRFLVLLEQFLRQKKPGKPWASAPAPSGSTGAAA